MLNPIRVLVVEDSADAAELMLRGLGDHGFAPQAERVETEAAYLAGLNAAPDVILADYRLPQFSGLRALELLNERRLDIPFIVVSGDIGDEEAAGLIKLGASDFLLKDRIARLGAAVTQAVKLKRARDDQRQMEEALVNSERRFRTLSENSSDLIIVIDRRDMITYISPSLKRIGGYEVSDALDRNFFDFIHPEDVSAATTNLAAIAQNRDALRVVELRCRHKNGNWLTLEMILRNALDEPILGGIVVNARDITERKNQEQKIVRLSRIHAVMSAINSLIVRVPERQELFQEACRIAVEHGNFGMAWVSEFDPETLDVTPIAYAGTDTGEFVRSKSTARVDLPLGQGVVGRAIRAKDLVFVNDMTAEPDVGSANRREAIRRGYRSLIALPLLVEGTIFGTLTLYAKELNFFNEDELKLLRELARDISFALEHNAKEEKIARLSRIHAVLSGINSLIVRVQDRQVLFNEACRIAVEHGGFGIAWIGVLNQETLEMTLVACAGVDAESFLARSQNTARPDTPMGQGVVGRAIREKRAVSSNDITTEPGVGGERRKEATRRGYRSSISLPLLMEGAAVGNFSLFAKKANFFTADEVKLLTELAGDISFALEHISKQEKLDKLSRIRAVMSAINSLIVRVRDRGELLNGACRIAVEHGGFGIAWIGMLNQETLEVTPAACAGVDADSLLARSPNTARPDTPLGQGLVGRAIREKRAVFSNDITTESSAGGERRKEAVRRGYRSLIVLPLLVEDAAVGNLALFAKEADFFVADEVKLLTELAGDVSFALQAIERQEKLDKLSRSRAVSGEINAAIVRIHDHEALLRETCRIAAEHGKFEMVWVALLDQEKQRIQPVAWAGFSSEIAHDLTWANLGTPGGTLGEVIRTRKVAVRNDIGTEIPAGILRQEAVKKGYRSTVCVPFMVDDSVVAAIILFASGVGFFDEEELALLNEVAADISLALHSITKQEKLDYLSYYDALTGLPNRTLFVDRLSQQMRSRGGEQQMVALIVIDIERFRNINESVGHRGGDELLKAIAGRLEHAFHGKDYLARIGSNAFGAIVRGMKDAAGVVHLIENEVFSCFRQPFTVSDRELRVSVKAGIAMFPADGEDADTLFRNAESALKRAKASGDRYLFYAANMNAQAAHVMALETRLRKAVDAQQFVLHYQPKIELATGRICGLEALIRWNDPESGLVPPGRFIPLLEETGMILEVGRWAIHKALQDFSGWHTQGLQPPRIAVNVSPIQLRQKDFVDVVRNAIREFTMGPHGLDLEITESLIMEDIEGNIEKLRAVKDMGVNIAIDDFGTGYSSLGYLARLPVNALKIDRSFIITLASNADSMTIVSTIISLAHSLRLKVIAEGVETEEQSKFLRLLKCDEIQGYLFSKPVPAEQVPALLESTSLALPAATTY